MTLTPGAMRPPAFSTRLRKTGDAASLRRRRLVVRASLFGKTGVCWNAFRGAGAAFGIRPGPPAFPFGNALTLNPHSVSRDAGNSGQNPGYSQRIALHPSGRRRNPHHRHRISGAWVLHRPSPRRAASVRPFVHPPHHRGLRVVLPGDAHPAPAVPVLFRAVRGHRPEPVHHHGILPRPRHGERGLPVPDFPRLHRDAPGGPVPRGPRPRHVASRTYEHLPLYITAGLLYFGITLVGVHLLRVLERKVHIPGYAVSGSM